jgi:hypothetical protein
MTGYWKSRGRTVGLLVCLKVLLVLQLITTRFSGISHIVSVAGLVIALLALI